MKIVLSLLIAIFVSLANAESGSMDNKDFQCNYLQTVEASATMDYTSSHAHVDCPQCLVINITDRSSEIIPSTITTSFTADVVYASFVSKITTPPPTA